MTRLPYDYCRCHDAECPERETCARWCQIARDRVDTRARWTTNSPTMNPERLAKCRHKIKERPDGKAPKS